MPTNVISLHHAPQLTRSLIIHNITTNWIYVLYIIRNSRSAVLQNFDYVFTENGLVAHYEGKLIAEKSILDFMGEEKL